MKNSRRTALLSLGASLAAVTGIVVAISPAAQGDPAYPTTPPAAICGSTSLNGPATAPTGAVAVPAGSNAGFDFGQANTTYYFESGVHTLTPGEFSQISPGDNSTFIGAPGAVLDGNNNNRYAFTQQAQNV